jgi:hypothetical protein
MDKISEYFTPKVQLVLGITIFSIFVIISGYIVYKSYQDSETDKKSQQEKLAQIQARKLQTQGLQTVLDKPGFQAGFGENMNENMNELNNFYRKLGLGLCGKEWDKDTVIKREFFDSCEISVSSNMKLSDLKKFIPVFIISSKMDENEKKDLLVSFSILTGFGAKYINNTIVLVESQYKNSKLENYGFSKNMSLYDFREKLYSYLSEQYNEPSFCIRTKRDKIKYKDASYKTINQTCIDKGNLLIRVSRGIDNLCKYIN